MTIDDPTNTEGKTLSPTERTTLRRHRERAGTDRAELFELLAAATVCHVGVTTDDGPLVLPTAFGVDPEGPDEQGTLYLHGSVASASLARAVDDVCVTVTIVDGVVLARSAFHHSMNYRSAVIRGRARPVTDSDEKAKALDLIVDSLVPGRSATLRAHTRRELAATSVIALSLVEASVKSRAGDPVDDPEDIETGGVWAGHVPISETWGTPVPSADLHAETDVPPDVTGVTTSTPSATSGPGRVKSAVDVHGHP